MARWRAILARRSWSIKCFSCASSIARSARNFALSARLMSISRARSAESAMIVIKLSATSTIPPFTAIQLTWFSSSIRFTLTSSTAKTAIMFSWCGKIPISPSRVLTETNVAWWSKTRPSGVTICTVIWAISHLLESHFFSFSNHIFNRTNAAKGIFRKMIIFTFKNFFKATNRISNWHIRAWLTGELFRHIKVLW